MTPQEFKAWFDGFTEAISGVPTKAQWARVKERVGEIDGKAVTEHHYHDTYWHHWNAPTWVYLSGSTAGDARGIGVAGNAANAYQSALGSCQNFNSLTAMNSLGRAEAQSIAA